MYVPFILARTAQLLLTDRSLLPAPMNTYQAPLLFMARMKSTCQSRSLLCVSSLIVPFFTVVELCVPAHRGVSAFLINGRPSFWFRRSRV